MTRAVIVIVLCMLAMSCKKERTPDNTCLTETQTAYYLDFWKKEFVKRNGMSQGWFDTHISDIKTSANCWNSGITFRVEYKVKIDWAVMEDYSDFMVKLSSSDPAYENLNIPRDVMFDTTQMQMILDNEIWYSAVGPLKPLNSLKYASYDAAIKAFRDSVKSNFISAQQLAYFVPGKLPRKDGYPYFIGYGIINQSANQCISGYFNLATGESYADTTACSMQ